MHSNSFRQIGLHLKPENTAHGGSITVWLTSSLTGLDLTKQVKLLLLQRMQSSRIQTI